jgi:hypothetical protein
MPRHHGRPPSVQPGVAAVPLILITHVLPPRERPRMPSINRGVRDTSGSQLARLSRWCSPWERAMTAAREGSVARTGEEAVHGGGGGGGNGARR